MNESINAGTIAFFVGLVFSAMTVAYNRLESERQSAAPKQLERQRWLVRTLACCSALGLTALTLTVVAKRYAWKIGDDLAFVAFLAVVAGSLYVVIVCFRKSLE